MLTGFSPSSLLSALDKITSQMKMHASAFDRCERGCSGDNSWLFEPERSRSAAPLTFKCMPYRGSLMEPRLARSTQCKNRKMPAHSVNWSQHLLHARTDAHTVVCLCRPAAFKSLTLLGMDNRPLKKQPSSNPPINTLSWTSCLVWSFLGHTWRRAVRS